MDPTKRPEIKKFIDEVELQDDYILVKAFGLKEAKTESGIIIPETRGVHRADRGIVIKGNDQVITGSKVVFHRWAIVELDIEGEKFGVLSLKDIIGIYERQHPRPVK